MNLNFEQKVQTATDECSHRCCPPSAARRLHVMEPDPTEAAHDGRCPVCGSAHIEFLKDIGVFPVHMMWEGKLCQRVRMARWLCDTCGRVFVANTFITQ